MKSLPLCRDFFIFVGDLTFLVQKSKTKLTMILVTGGTGLLGSHLLFDLLKRYDKVVATKRASSNIEGVKKVFSYYTDEQTAQQMFDRIEWREADILNVGQLYDAMEGIDEVYHCAAIVSFTPREKEKVFKHNIEGTANMVNVSLERGIRKFVYASSVAAMGTNPDGVITEETYAVPDEKYSVYSKSKYYAELEVWRGQEEGLNVIIVNPSIILGPPVDWKKKMIGRMFYQVWEGMPVYIEGVVGYVDVRDVVKAMLMLSEREIYGERFIVSAENLSFYEIFSMVAEALGRPKPKYKVNDLLLSAAFVVDQLRSMFTFSDPILTKETVKYANTRDYYSSEKLLKTLPEFKFTPIRETINFMAKLFLEQLTPEERARKGIFLKALELIGD